MIRNSIRRPIYAAERKESRLFVKIKPGLNPAPKKNCPGSIQGACIRHGHTVHMRGMIVRSIRHRGVRQLYENNSARLLKQDQVERVRGILSALAMAETMEGFVREAAPGWRVHRLSGERRNEWSVSVSGNWRITFEERNGAIERLNLEDYH